HLLELSSGKSTLVQGEKADFSRPTFSKESRYLAFLATEDSVKAKRPYYDLFLHPIGKGETKKIADKDTKGLLEAGMVSKHGKLNFSNDESRLYFGTAPDYIVYPYEEDTTILDEERVKLDIWGWQDDDIQPMQLVNRGDEEKKTFVAAYQIKEGRIIQLAKPGLEDFRFDKDHEHDFALAYDASPYRRNYSWDIQIGKDMYVVDLKTGVKELVRRNVTGNPVLSPAGKYAYWYES